MASVPLSAGLILAACIAVGLLNEVSGAVLTLTMPEAARDIGATQAASQFVLLAGKLSLGALMLAGGGAGDRFGRKRTMLVGTALVALAAILSALAQSTGMLASARVLDGVGNALVGPLALALALAAFPEEMRGRVIGLFLGISGLGVAIGPLVAGVLVQAGGWRVGFVAPFVLALAGGAALAVLSKPEHSQPQRPPWDPIGMLTCILGLVAVVLGFIQAGRHGWLAPDTLLLLGAGLALLGCFGWWETHRAAVPMMDPALLRSREVLTALAAALLAAMVLNGTVLPLLYFLQRIHGHDKVASVVRLLPLILAAMVVAPLAGGLAERYGRRRIMLAGLLAMTAGSGVMAMLDAGMSYAVIAVALLLLGAGVMAVITPAADLVMSTSGAARSGAAAALNGAVMQVGGAIGIGIITSLFLAKGQQSFVAVLTARGYSRDQVIGPVLALREIVRETPLRRMPQLPDIPPQMQRDILDAYAQAFAAGVAHTFVVAGALSLVAMAVLLIGMRPSRNEPAAAPRP